MTDVLVVVACLAVAGVAWWAVVLMAERMLWPRRGRRLSATATAPTPEPEPAVRLELPDDQVAAEFAQLTALFDVTAGKPPAAGRKEPK